jgi:hypothetical protein
VPHTATGSKAPQHTAAKAPSRPPPTAGENGGTGEDGDKDSGSDSSSSSSGGSSSSSGSDSDGGEQRGSTYNAGDGATGGNKAAKAGGDAMEASALVSVTGPHGSSQPSILKHQSSKKEVNLQNANAWASLAGNQGETGEGGADNKEEGGKVCNLLRCFQSFLILLMAYWTSHFSQMGMKRYRLTIEDDHMSDKYKNVGPLEGFLFSNLNCML